MYATQLTHTLHATSVPRGPSDLFIKNNLKSPRSFGADLTELSLVVGS